MMEATASDDEDEDGGGGGGVGGGDDELVRVADLRPDSLGCSLVLRSYGCVSVVQRVPVAAEQAPRVRRNPRRVADVVVGDGTGHINMIVCDEHIASVLGPSLFLVRNAQVRMVDGHMRLMVGKFGSIEKLPGRAFGDECAQGMNMSHATFSYTRNH